MKREKKKRFNTSNSYSNNIIIAAMTLLCMAFFLYFTVNWKGTDMTRIKEICKHADEYGIRKVIRYDNKLMAVVPSVMCNRHPDQDMIVKNYLGDRVLCKIKYRKFGNRYCCTVTPVRYCATGKERSESE